MTVLYRFMRAFTFVVANCGPCFVQNKLEYASYKKYKLFAGHGGLHTWLCGHLRPVTHYIIMIAA